MKGKKKAVGFSFGNLTGHVSINPGEKLFTVTIKRVQFLSGFFSPRRAKFETVWTVEKTGPGYLEEDLRRVGLSGSDLPSSLRGVISGKMRELQ
jgi:hypothetical protein